jgi:pimeloyl-ACP methyl ester carboxylesterase
MDEILINGWRRLAVRRGGNAAGHPVFLLHGTPGSRLSARPTDEELDQLGVCLITYDRPGYGGSDPYPGRSVAHAANDVRAIADEFGYHRFAVLGRSGGGPHALACAALLPDRVTRVASLVTLAPYDANGLDWLAAALGPAELAQVMYPLVVAMRANPEHFAERLSAEASPGDRAVLADPDYHTTFISNMSEAISQSLDGWAADNLAFTRPWGFEPHWISVPTLLWHGLRDVFSPVTHAHWLAERIAGAVLLLSDRAHLNAASVQGSAIHWLLTGEQPKDGLIR